MTRTELEAQLEKVDKEFRSWPEWKSNDLRQASMSMSSTAREPVDNQQSQFEVDTSADQKTVPN